jgi:hypothetical protein
MLVVIYLLLSWLLLLLVGLLHATLGQTSLHGLTACRRYALTQHEPEPAADNIQKPTCTSSSQQYITNRWLCCTLGIRCCVSRLLTLQQHNLLPDQGASDGSSC